MPSNSSDEIFFISILTDHKVKRSRQGALYLPSQKINHVNPHPPFKKNTSIHTCQSYKEAVTPKSPSIFCLKENITYILTTKSPSTCKGLLFRYYLSSKQRVPACRRAAQFISGLLQSHGHAGPNWWVFFLVNLHGLLAAIVLGRGKQIHTMGGCAWGNTVNWSPTGWLILSMNIRTCSWQWLLSSRLMCMRQRTQLITGGTWRAPTRQRLNQRRHKFFYWYEFMESIIGSDL